MASIWVVPQKQEAFVPRGARAFFICVARYKPRKKKGAKYHEQNSAQILFERRGDAQTVVQLPDPMLNPQTLEPAKEEDLYPVFCKELAKQELDNTTRYVDIPEEIQEMYKIYRPSPLIRAYNLEKALDTPAKIYYKFEGNNTSGSHKLNSAIAQAY